MSGLYSTSFFLFHLFPSFYLSLLALSFLFFKLEANYFTILWWVLPYIHMNPPWVYVFPILNSAPTSLPIPSLRVILLPPALSTLSHASNLNWLSISHMIIYGFQCYSLKSSHPHLLPQSPKVCSLHLCLFCAQHFLTNQSQRVQSLQSG